MFEGVALFPASGEPADGQATFDLFSARLREEGIGSAPEILAALIERGVSPEDPLAAEVLNEVIAALVRAFDADPLSPAAYDMLAKTPAAFASVMFDLVLNAVFGDQPRDLSILNVKASLCLVGTLSAAGQHERAAVLLSEINNTRQHYAVRHAAWIARCRWAGCTDDIADHWAAPLPHFATPADAEAAIAQAELDIDAHRACARLLLQAGQATEALNGLCVALALPVGESDKLAIANELALTAAVLIVRGDRPLLERQRTRWALAMCPKVVTEAVSILQDSMARGALPFLDEQEALAAETLLLASIGQPAQGMAARPTGYPVRGDKPGVSTVWLEITNHCNQKCTFCPDMFREEPRTWQPLDQIKRVLDELAETCSVGSLQLNAYGEPLLHPNIAEILGYIRERNLPFPIFFTTHGMTLVDKKLRQLSHNYPAGIAVSLHNDSQKSYELTRSGKIGDYETLVSRVTGLMRQMVEERAPCHLRLYQMVSNGNVDMRVDEQTRAAFPDTPERMLAHIRKWEAIAAEIAAAAPPEACAKAHVNSPAYIGQAFAEATHDDANHMPVLTWKDELGLTQTAFMSARPIGSYANLLLEYDPRWKVERKIVNKEICGFVGAPSLAVFASGKLGICCLDLNSTATFGSLSDYANISEALTSPEALRIFAQLSNGVATSRGCQICLGGSERLCGQNGEDLPRPTRPAGHFREGI